MVGAGEASELLRGLCLPASYRAFRACQIAEKRPVGLRRSAGIKASLEAEAIARFDENLAELLRNRSPNDPLSVPHRVWIATGIKTCGGFSP